MSKLLFVYKLPIAYRSSRISVWVLKVFVYTNPSVTNLTNLRIFFLFFGDKIRIHKLFGVGGLRGRFGVHGIVDVSENEVLI